MTTASRRAPLLRLSHRPKSSVWERETIRLLRRAGLNPLLGRAVAAQTKSNGQTSFSYPDAAFTAGALLYLDGCYWHGCPTHWPGRARPSDRDAERAIEARGWLVLRAWECDGAAAAAERTRVAVTNLKKVQP